MSEIPPRHLFLPSLHPCPPTTYPARIPRRVSVRYASLPSLPPSQHAHLCFTLSMSEKKKKKSVRSTTLPTSPSTIGVPLMYGPTTNGQGCKARQKESMQSTYCSWSWSDLDMDASAAWIGIGAGGAASLFSPVSRYLVLLASGQLCSYIPVPDPRYLHHKGPATAAPPTSPHRSHRQYFKCPLSTINAALTRRVRGNYFGDSPARSDWILRRKVNFHTTPHAIYDFQQSRSSSRTQPVTALQQGQSCTSMPIIASN